VAALTTGGHRAPTHQPGNDAHLRRAMMNLTDHETRLLIDALNSVIYQSQQINTLKPALHAS